MLLRPYQAEARSQIREAWLTDDLLMYTMATGGGKTVLFVDVIREAIEAGQRIMLVAHRKELILQAWQTLKRIGIHSGIIMSGFPERFELAVQVCSVQTIGGRSELPPADIVIFDEGHHAQRDNTYGKIISRYRHAKCLFVTALPYRLSGEGFLHLHPAGKPTKLLVGPNLRQLTDDGWLVPLRYFIADIPDLTSIKMSTGDYSESELEKRMLAMAPLVDTYLEHARGKRGVVFAVTLEHSRQIVKQYLEAGVAAEHLDGETPDDQRSSILQRFRTGLLRVIVNVGIITEGFDFPDCEFIQLARPTKSLSLFLQMVGRVTRALAGVVDIPGYTAEQRKRSIAASAKPCGIILDNAGCYIEHGFPTKEHDVEYYFLGAKRHKKPVEETIEILVYVAEDENGVRRRTKNPEELKGMRLIEVTEEVQKRVTALASLKEFDRLYFMLKNRMAPGKKFGFTVFYQFKSLCEAKNLLITDQMWEYIYNKLVGEVNDKLAALERDRARNLEFYPDELYKKLTDAARMEGVPERFFQKERGEYERRHFQEILSARFA